MFYKCKAKKLLYILDYFIKATSLAPGPQTVDLIPAFSIAGTRLIEPPML